MKGPLLSPIFYIWHAILFYLIANIKDHNTSIILNGPQIIEYELVNLDARWLSIREKLNQEISLRIKKEKTKKAITVHSQNLTNIN